MELLDKCGEYENEYLSGHGAVLYPGVEETFARLKEKYELYIVSNCQSGYIEAFLSYYKLGKYISDIECYGNNEKQKEDNIALDSIPECTYRCSVCGRYPERLRIQQKGRVCFYPCSIWIWHN